MRWRPNFNVSSRGRYIALGVVAVLLPLSILGFLQYRSMVDLEARTKVAVRENLRQSLQSVGRKMEAEFEELAKDALFPIAEAGKAEQEDKEGLEKQFAAALGRHPEIAQLFFIAQCACRAKEEHRGYFFTGEGLRSIGYSELDEDIHAQSAVQAYEQARSSAHHIPASGRDFFFGHECASCQAKENGHHQTYIFRTVHGPGTEERIGFAGMIFKTDYIQKQFLAHRIPELLQGPDLALADSNLALAIFDERKQEIYANSKGNVEYEVRTPFSRPFPQWEMRIGFNGTTVGALARSNFYKNLVLTLVTVFVLLIGIFLIVRAAGREIKHAQIKSDFVSNVSHELKTPLTTIRLFAEMLNLGRVKNSEEAQEYYGIIENESRRLSQLIDNILDFSRIEAGRKNYELVESNIGGLVEEVIKSYEYQIVSSGFNLKVEIQPNLPPIMIDPAAISQALLNLLNNAVKYSNAIRNIGVQVFQSGEYVAVEVADNGIGIPRSEQQKIFEKFHRVGTTLVHNTKGSGLGLSLVKHIVDAHRGAVRVESMPGEGSRFTLLLPVKDTLVGTKEARPRAGGYDVAESLNN